MHHRSSQCWRRRWRADRTRRQDLTAREGSDLVARQRFAIEECGRDSVQQVHVLLQHLSRAHVSLLDHARDLGVDELGGALGDFAPRLKLAAEEKLLLVVADENGTNLVRQSPLRYVASREPGRLLNVARRASSHALATEDQLLRNTAAVRFNQVGFELLGR